MTFLSPQPISIHFPPPLPLTLLLPTLSGISPLSPCLLYSALSSFLLSLPSLMSHLSLSSHSLLFLLFPIILPPIYHLSSIMYLSIIYLCLCFLSYLPIPLFHSTFFSLSLSASLLSTFYVPPFLSSSSLAPSSKLTDNQCPTPLMPAVSSQPPTTITAEDLLCTPSSLCLRSLGPQVKICHLH